MFKIIALGINGYIPTYNRHTMSYLLYNESEIFILDAGTGLSNLMNPDIKKIISDRTTLNIILSHYHLDHISGLSYLPGLLDDQIVNLYAPDKPFVDVSPEAAIDKYLNQPFFSLPFDGFPFKTNVIPITNSSLTINQHKFEFHRLNHHGGSMGIKIDNHLAYITDTNVNEDYLSFISGVKYLMHEVWLTKEDVKNNKDESERHSVFEDVVTQSKRANNYKFIPIHLNPNWDSNYLHHLFSETNNSTNNVMLLNECDIYSLD